MPSGSHGGSPGSHSSGGSSSGGGGGSHSSGGYSGGGSYRRRPRRPRYYHRHGRRYVVSTGRQQFISNIWIAIFVSVIVMIGSFMIVNGANSDLDKIRSDFNYYQNMVSNAERNPEYQHIGKVKDKFLNEDADNKWYITYTFQTEGESPRTVDGYTFSIYTLEEVSDFVIGEEIMLAMNMTTVLSYADSVPMDYKNFPIESDGEYVEFTNRKGMFNIVAWVCVAATVGFVVLCIYLSLGKRDTAAAEVTTTYSSSTSADNSQKSVYCEYCGAKNPAGESKCSNCGAGLK